MEKATKYIALILFLFIINSFAKEIDQSKIDELKNMVGQYNPKKNYKILIDGIGTGYKPINENEWNVFTESFIEVKKNTTLPSKLDNSKTKWFPPVGKQGSKGSCVTWSTIYYAKTFQEAKEHNWDLSRCKYGGLYPGEPDVKFQSLIMSPDFVYHLSNNGKDNGISMIDVGEILQNIGTSSWRTMPYRVYNYSDWPEENAFREAPLYRSKTSVQSYYMDSDESIGGIKSLLVNGALPTINIDANNFKNFRENYLWTLDNYSPKGTNHATTIVGFDNNFGPYDENGKEVYGAFKVVNSGGENWGDNGFFYISYACIVEKIKYVQFFEDLVDYQPELITVFRFSHQYRSDCNISFGVGSDNIKLKSKSFFDGIHDEPKFSFPSNSIAFDITEFAEDFHNSNQSIIMHIEDYTKPDIGKINYFSVEEYQDYSQKPTQVFINEKTPVQSINNSSLQLFISTRDSDYVDIQFNKWTIDFNEIFIGYNDTNYLNIQNLGKTVELKLNLEEYENFKLPYNSIQLAPSEILSLPIIFESDQLGEFLNILSVEIENTNRPAFTIPIKGKVIESPNIQVEFDESEIVINESDSLSKILKISNLSGSELNYNIQCDFQCPDTIFQNIIYQKTDFSNDTQHNGFQLINSYNNIIDNNTGMTIVNDKIYYINNEKLFCYDMINQQKSELFQIHREAFGIVWDGDLFWIGRKNSDLYGYNIYGEVVDYIEIPIYNYISVAYTGKYFIAASSENSNLVIFDREGNTLFKAEHIIPGTTHDIDWSYSIPESPLLILDKLSKTLYLFSLSNNELSFINSIKLVGFEINTFEYNKGKIWISDYNSNIRIIDINIDDWIRLNNQYGTLQNDQSEEIVININTLSLDIEKYTCDIRINHNDPGKDEIIKNISLNILNDTQPPAQITDLKIYDFGKDSIAIKWTSVGDNDNFGVCENYDIRCSFDPITEDNFFSSKVIDNSIKPKYSNIIDNFVIRDLEPLTEYNIAIKAVDDARNYSLLSNIVSTTTKDSILISLNSIIFKDIIGNSDNIPNPGELIEINKFELVNQTNSDWSSLILEFDTTGIEFLQSIANKNYFKNQIKLDFEEPLIKGKSKAIFNINTLLIPGNIPDGTILELPIWIKDQNHNVISYDYLRIPIKGKDIIPPFIYNDNYSYCIKGDSVLIFAQFFDGSNIESINADFKSITYDYRNGNRYNVEMFDDGKSVDAGKNDGIYSAVFIPNEKLTYYVNLNVKDELNNKKCFIDQLILPLKNLKEDFDILIINSDTLFYDGNSRLNENYLDIIDPQYICETWDYFLNGPLVDYPDDKILIYNLPFNGINYIDTNIIKSHLDKCGKMLINGYKINKILSEQHSTFYKEYFHSEYVSTTPSSHSTMSGSPDDSLTHSLNFKILWGKVEGIKLLNDDEPIIFKNLSDPVGIKINEGYKLINLGFPIIKIDANDREDKIEKILMSRILNWLMEDDESHEPEGSIERKYLFSLSQNYPNPFNGFTMIKYTLPNDCNVEFTVFDIQGRKIHHQKEINQKAGENIFYFDSSDLSSGVYFYQIKTGDFTKTKKMLLMK